MIGELLSEVGGRVGHGLIRVVCASLSLFRQFFRIARTRETLQYIIYASRAIVREIQLSVET